ncbi:MAG: prevent-host-death protein [Planctomycetota bacterium]
MVATFLDMRAVDLEVLKNKLSEFVRLAAGGEVVLITDRDRVVAEIVPPQLGRSATSTDARLADLICEGVLTPPTLPASVPLPPMKPIMRFDQLMADLQRDREER